MKFFHLSDLHLGLKLFNRDLGEDQRFILHEITKMAEKERPDALLIAGDIYDKAIPSVEAVEIFDTFLKELRDVLPNLPVMIISGNHDSAPRMNVFRAVLSDENIHMIGLPPRTPEEHIEKVTIEDEYGEVHFYLLPFVSPSMVSGILGKDEEDRNFSYDESVRRLVKRESIDPSSRNVFVSHQFYLPKGAYKDKVERMDSEILTVGNIDAVGADVLSRFDYAALGHIHKPMKVGSDFHRYSGTPLACSVSEAGQEKAILMVCMKEKGTVEVKRLPLKPLREVRILKGRLSELLKEETDDFVTVVLTDKEDLDVIEMQESLRSAFPNLLEIRRETLSSPLYRDMEEAFREKEIKNPLSLCSLFLPDMDEEEKNLLTDIINTIKEGT